MKKILLTIIVSTFLLNSLFFVFSGELKSLEAAQVSELPLFSVVSVLGSSSNQITDLVKSNMPLGQVLTQPQDGSQNNSKANDNSYVFNTSAVQLSFTVRSISNTGYVYTLPFAEESALQFRQNYLVRCRGWTNFLCVFLLIYLVLLSKSNLPWEIAVKKTF